MNDMYDLVVIGSGPAGRSAAELASFIGHSALIVERGLPGGTVTTVGGAPTKTLREAALDLTRTHADQRMSLAGQLQTLRTRTLSVCRSLQSATADEIAARGIAYLNGTARFTSCHSLRVDLADGSVRELTARAVIVATGSRPRRLPNIAYRDPAIHDSEEIFRIQELPRNITIAGGGPVGVEFATVFATLGVPVTLVDPGDRLLPSMDRELVGVMQTELERAGTRVLLGAGIEQAERAGDRLEIQLSNGERLTSSALLLAAGRAPNIEGLGLDVAGVGMDGRGRILVDRYHQTSCPGVYAVGDVVGPTLASLAMQQGRAAVCHAFGLAFGIPIDHSPSAAVYGVPELASVGATEEQLQAASTPYVVGRCDLAKTARGAIAGQAGRLKLLVRADDRRLLGVHCVGEIASELVGMAQAVLHLAGQVDVFLTLALNTPTYTAAYRDAAIDALAQLAALAGRPRALHLQLDGVRS
jgi:NAD(P) transhydrogenase